MPFGKHKKDIDLSVHPETKYNRILYTADRRSASDDELPPVTRRRRPAGRTPGKLAGLLSSLGAFRVKRPKDSCVKARVSAKQETGRQDGGGRVLRSDRNNRKKQGGFLQDKLLRTTSLVCIAVAAVSLITVQTTFAKPGTPITLIDNGRELQCETTAQTVGEFLEDNAVALDEEDVVSTELSAPLYEGQTITIYRAVPITIKSNGTETQVSIVAGHTVQDALDKAGIVPAENDEVYPSPDTIVRSGMTIDHIVVTTQETTEDQAIPFDNTTKEDPTMPKGEHDIVQAGQEGVLRITYKQIYKNGVLISQDSISEDVVQQPVDQVMAIGTYVEPEKPKETTKKTTTKKSSGSSGSSSKSSNGSSSKGSSGSSSSSSSSSGSKSDDTDLNGSKGMKMQLTAYCSFCNSGSKTSSGTYPAAGRTVACNSLPLGTRIYIEGYGEFVVEDRGGMGGNVVDIYMGDQPNDDVCNNFGRTSAMVYVIG